jgi:hypothetical protein
MKNVITPQQAVLLMERSRGRIFSVSFVKRTTGELRVMTCRKSVKKGVNGKGLKFDPLKKSLMTVFDMHKAAWRSVNINTLKAISINGEKFFVTSFNLNKTI